MQISASAIHHTDPAIITNAHAQILTLQLQHLDRMCGTEARQNVITQPMSHASKYVMQQGVTKGWSPEVAEVVVAIWGAHKIKQVCSWNGAGVRIDEFLGRGPECGDGGRQLLNCYHKAIFDAVFLGREHLRSADGTIAQKVHYACKSCDLLSC